MKQETVKLASGKTAFRWSNYEKPALNYWYQLRECMDYWKIQKRLLLQGNEHNILSNPGILQW